MDFKISENQKMIIDMVQKFGAQHISPFVDQWDEKQFLSLLLFENRIDNKHL